MADRSDKHQRTEKPTDKRLRKAYEQGNVARSVDVNHAAALGVFLLWAALGGAGFLTGLLAFVRGGVSAVAGTLDANRLPDQGLDALREGLRLLAPLLLLLLVFGVAATAIQGVHLRKPPLRLELTRLNPITGLRAFCNVQRLAAAAKAIARVIGYALIGALVVAPEWPRIAGLALLGPAAILNEAAAIAGRLLLRALLLGIVIAVADYGFTRRHWYRSLYMTKQELKDERKEEENPEIRARVRAKQREVARRRMMAAVRTADVVVTNPTHLAVALKYDRARMPAPTVVAKGRGYVALRIREEAQQHHVPIVEDPPLARVLEQLCPLGAAIPETLYRAVAEVFAYVFQRRRGRYQPHTDIEVGAPSEATP